MFFDQDTELFGFMKIRHIFLSAISQQIFLNNISFKRAEKTEQNAILVHMSNIIFRVRKDLKVYQELE